MREKENAPTFVDDNLISPPATQEEIDAWKSLRGRIKIRETLQTIKEINSIDFKAYLEGEDWATMTNGAGETVEWDGTTSFWGVKRLIMMLFDENKQGNVVFSHLTPEAQEAVLAIDTKTLLK